MVELVLDVEPVDLEPDFLLIFLAVRCAPLVPEPFALDPPEPIEPAPDPIEPEDAPIEPELSEPIAPVLDEPAPELMEPPELVDWDIAVVASASVTAPASAILIIGPSPDGANRA